MCHVSPSDFKWCGLQMQEGIKGCVWLVFYWSYHTQLLLKCYISLLWELFQRICRTILIGRCKESNLPLLKWLHRDTIMLLLQNPYLNKMVNLFIELVDDILEVYQILMPNYLYLINDFWWDHVIWKDCFSGTVFKGIFSAPLSWLYYKTCGRFQ